MKHKITRKNVGIVLVVVGFLYWIPGNILISIFFPQIVEYAGRLLISWLIGIPMMFYGFGMIIESIDPITARLAKRFSTFLFIGLISTSGILEFFDLSKPIQQGMIVLLFVFYVLFGGMLFGNKR